MEFGDEVEVEIINEIDSGRYEVYNRKIDKKGYLTIKGKLKINKNGTAKVWVMDYDPKYDKYVYGNSYFGKFTISEKISKRYLKIFEKLYNTPEDIIDDDISFLKGMANRCVKRDQWDWLTTYKYLGFPAKKYLINFVQECITIRDSIRESQIEPLLSFRDKYNFIFRSMQFHLNSVNGTVNPDSYSSINEMVIDNLLWRKLSIQSKVSIRTIQQYSSINSVYLMMHYFTVLEQEFKLNYIEPFKRSIEDFDRIQECRNRRYKRTHNILLGLEHFSLGSISFIGSALGDSQAITSSEAIRLFGQYIGRSESEFVRLCRLISNIKIDNLFLKDIRNGIAHGNTDIIDLLSDSTSSDLFNVLFKKPSEIIFQILRSSLNDD